MQISEQLYQSYLKSLLNGEHQQCRSIINQLIAKKVDITALYLDLFKRSMYEVGSLWEREKISVATEHMCTLITESLLPLSYPLLTVTEHNNKRVLISCVPGEHHQIGALMVANYCEMLGWHAYSLGANTPLNALLSKIDDLKPDIFGISVSISFNLDSMEKVVRAVSEEFPEQKIIIGGHAFEVAEGKYKPEKFIEKYPNCSYVDNLDSLKNLLTSF